MTREELLVLVKGMKAVYADPKFIPDRDAFDVWFGLLSDVPYEVASAAVKKYMMTERRPPTIADVRSGTAEVANAEIPESGEAWAKVLRAVKRFGYYQQPAALESLDPVTREAAERFGFRELCDVNANDIGVARGQFMRIYEQIAARRKADMALPVDLRKSIEMLRTGELALEAKQ